MVEIINWNWSDAQTKVRGNKSSTQKSQSQEIVSLNEYSRPLSFGDDEAKK